MRCFALIATLAACGDNVTPLDAPISGVEVALVPSAPADAVDVLFVIQDSCCVLDKQILLKNAMVQLIDELAARPGGLPSLHIGVVSSDLGTSSANDVAPGPPVGTGFGSCSGTGKGGALQTNGSTLVNGTFISDLRNSDGTRTTNYTGSLAGAFSTIASLGASGCAFEQHLRAAQVALDDNPANVGFRRTDAALVVVVLAEDEDCSAGSTELFSQSTPLGPLGTFRCFRHGVTCDVGGATPDDMNVPGLKAGCHSNEDSPVIAPVAPIIAVLETLVSDPRMLLLAVIAGDPEPVEVALVTPPGGGSGVPGITASCSYQGVNGTELAQPGVRLAQAARSVRRNVLVSACGEYTGATRAIGRQVRSLVGDRCLTSEIAVPADCEVADELADNTRWSIPACSPTLTDGCYTLVADPSCTTTHQLAVDVKRIDPPRPATMVSVRCRL